MSNQIASSSLRGTRCGGAVYSDGGDDVGNDVNGGCFSSYCALQQWHPDKLAKAMRSKPDRWADGRRKRGRSGPRPRRGKEAAVAKTPDEAAVEFLVDPSEREVWRVPFVGAACLAVVASAAALVVASARRGDSHLEAPFLHMAGEV